MGQYKSKFTGGQIDDGIEAAPLILSIHTGDATTDMAAVDSAWGKKPIFAKYTYSSGPVCLQCVGRYTMPINSTVYYAFTCLRYGKEYHWWLMQETINNQTTVTWADYSTNLVLKSELNTTEELYGQYLAYYEFDEDGIALNNIAKGEYLIIPANGEAYQAVKDIESGDELIDSGANKNITVVTEGIANSLKSALDNKQDTLTTVVDASPVTPSTGASIPAGTQCAVKKYGNIINLSGILQKTLVLNQWNELGMLNSQYWDGERMLFVFLNSTKDAPVEGDIDSDGTVRVYPTSANSSAAVANIAFNIVYVIS